MYAAIDPDDVSVTNTDDDTAGVTITPTELAMTEAVSGTYQIALHSTSSGGVTMAITFDPAQVAVSRRWTSSATLSIVV